MEAVHIRQMGAPLELYDRPANRFVAGFIGSPAMNMLDGVVRLNGSATVEVGETRLPIADAGGLSDGQKVIFGVRPEDMTLSDSGLATTISVVEPTGSEMHVVSKRNDAEIVSVFRERHALKPDQPIHLAPDPTRLHFFDPETGARIGQ